LAFLPEIAHANDFLLMRPTNSQPTHTFAGISAGQRHEVLGQRDAEDCGGNAADDALGRVDEQRRGIVLFGVGVFLLGHFYLLKKLQGLLVGLFGEGGMLHLFGLGESDLFLGLRLVETLLFLFDLPLFPLCEPALRLLGFFERLFSHRHRALLQGHRDLSGQPFNFLRWRHCGLGRHGSAFRRVFVFHDNRRVLQQSMSAAGLDPRTWHSFAPGLASVCVVAAILHLGLGFSVCSLLLLGLVKVRIHNVLIARRLYVVVVAVGLLEKA
jgi:hypothetical protein